MHRSSRQSRDYICTQTPSPASFEGTFMQLSKNSPIEEKNKSIKDCCNANYALSIYITTIYSLRIFIWRPGPIRGGSGGTLPRGPVLWPGRCSEFCKKMKKVVEGKILKNLW